MEDFCNIYILVYTGLCSANHAKRVHALFDYQTHIDIWRHFECLKDGKKFNCSIIFFIILQIRAYNIEIL